jgi:hypothetical protein
MDKNKAAKLERFAQFIEKLPRKAFNMSDWVIPGKKFDASEGVNKNNIHSCGTQCCLAGWRAVQKGRTLDANGMVRVKGSSLQDVYAPKFAREDLGLTMAEDEKLFYPNGWPLKEDGTKMFKPTPKGAAARIRRLIATGE